MNHINNIENRIYVVNKILKYLKLDILNDEEKQAIYNIVMSTKKTDLQKRRYKKVASFYDCSVGAVRTSTMSIVAGLYHLPDEKFSVLENILKKYEK